MFKKNININEPITNFLLNRMATAWNNQPKEISLAPSVNSFKSRLDSHLGTIRGKTRIDTLRAAINVADEYIW